METKIIKLNPASYDIKELESPADCIRNGGLVIVPTETVYGISANRDNPTSVSNLLSARKSTKEKLLTLHISSPSEIEKHIKPSLLAKKIMRKFWPGPLTIVFPIQGQGRGIGIRCPANSIAQDIIKLADVPVVIASANMAGEVPQSDAEGAAKIFSGKVDYIVDGGPSTYGKSSTCVKIEGGRIEFLREGAIPKYLIEKEMYLDILFVCTGNTCRSPVAEGLAKKMLGEKYGVGIDELPRIGYRIHSAGTSAIFGMPSTQEIKSIGSEFCVNLEKHFSMPIAKEMIEKADYIYVMELRHKDILQKISPQSVDKIILLNPDGSDIADPLGHSPDVYKNCVNIIKDSLEKRISEF